MRLGAAILAFLFVGAAQAAEPKPDPTRLTPADVALMDRTAERLYRGANVVEGATDTWRDERTGSFGRITLLKSFERTSRGTGVPCRRVQYDTSIRARPDPTTTTVTWCRQPNGVWKLL